MLLLSLTLCACAQRMEPGPLVPIPKSQANAVWHAYSAYSHQNQARQSPFRLNSAVRMRQIDAEGDSRSQRATALIWGNGKPDDPIRLDLTAGFGTVIARLISEPGNFSMYVPREKTVWFYEGPDAPLLNLGTPLPLSFDHIVAILQGRMQDVLGTSYASATSSPLDKTTIRFTLKKEYLGLQKLGIQATEESLDIDENGLLMLWQENAQLAWQMTVSYNASSPPLPKKIFFSHPDGYEVTLIIKQRAQVKTLFPLEKMALEIPKGTIWMPITAKP